MLITFSQVAVSILFAPFYIKVLLLFICSVNIYTCTHTPSTYKNRIVLSEYLFGFALVFLELALYQMFSYATKYSMTQISMVI